MIEEKTKVPNCVRYDLIDKDGKLYGPFGSVIQAATYAASTWPDQEQDEARTGKGWDVQVVGADG